ncbi:hypothetical protein D3C76_1639110 [compost metagenome]
MLDTSSGRAMRFSWRYMAGAMKLQAWCNSTGMATNSAAIRVSLNGARNGEVTLVAIMLAPSGR